MTIKNTLPCTYHSFNPFRADFDHDVPGDHKRLKSVEGRLYCLFYIAISPVNIPLKIARKVFLFANALFMLLAQSTKLQKNYFFHLKNNAICTADRFLSLIFSPINIVAGRVRYVVGLLNPEWAFKS